MKWLISKNPAIWLLQIFISSIYIFNNPITDGFFYSKIHVYSHKNPFYLLAPNLTYIDLLDKVFLCLAVVMIVIGLHNAISYFFSKAKMGFNEHLALLILLVALYIIIVPWMPLILYFSIFVEAMILSNILLLF